MLLTDRLQELSSKATGVNVKIPAAMLRQIYVNTERQHDKQRPSYTCGPFLLQPLLLRTCTHVIYFHTQSMIYFHTCVLILAFVICCACVSG